MREYRLSVVDEGQKEIYLIGYFLNKKELFQWIKSNWKELDRIETGKEVK